MKPIACPAGSSPESVAAAFRLPARLDGLSETFGVAALGNPTLAGWSEVPVLVAANLDDVANALRAERDENTCRLEFAPTEAVAMAAALRPHSTKLSNW